MRPSAPYSLGRLRVLRSPQGWAVAPVHYSHDPTKGPEWYERERAKYSTQAAWDQEMEIDFSSQRGTRAYSNFVHQLHVVDGLELRGDLPIMLACDFNVSPCAWVVAQKQRRDGRDVLVVVDEVVLDPGPIAQMVQEFDNRFRGTSPVLHIYGDAAGRSRSVQTSFSDYDLVLQGLKHWPRMSLLVPRANPPIRDRLNAVNGALLDGDGVARLLVNPRCVELIEDMQTVMLDDRTRLILKSTKADDPYRMRTHTSDALGYLVWSEMPVSMGATSEETSDGAGELVDFWARQRAGSGRPKPRVLGELR